MNNPTTHMYFFSTEGYSKELPCEVKLVRVLANKNSREALLVESERYLSLYHTKFLVLVPRHEGMSLLKLPDDEPVFAHVVNGADYITKESIDLSEGNKLLIDIGGLASRRSVAEVWQPKKAD